MDKITQYKTMTITSQKADSEDLREFSALITNEAQDRDNEVLLASGMKKSDFLNNGIILFNHDPDQPIGTATALRRSGNGWIAKGRIAENVQKAEEVWQLLKQGILKGVSVGFTVIEQRAPTKKDFAEFGKNVSNIISKWNLLEFSVVSVGANQEALVLGTKDMSITAKDILGNEFVEDEEKTNIVDTIEEVEEVKEDKEEEVSNIVEEVEKQLDEMEIEIKTATKEKIVEVVKEKKVDMDLVMKYFREEMQKQIRKSRGELF
jgi:HK97 family phage prohead protease